MHKTTKIPPKRDFLSKKLNSDMLFVSSKSSCIFQNHLLLTMSAVSLAITSSSLVGIK